MKRKIVLFIALFSLLFYSNTFAIPELQLPFEGGLTLNVTRGYDTASHQDYGSYDMDDRKALDFVGDGCDSWNSPILSAANGTVINAHGVDDNGYGKYVIIDHGEGYHSRYAHLNLVSVSVGQYVYQGQEIGKMGNTGNVEGTACSDHEGLHLHFALYHNGNACVPEPMSGYTDFVAWDIYTSLNCYNPPTNDYRVGKYDNGYVYEGSGDTRPYSRPFPVTYFHDQGADMLGYPISDVYLLENCLGCYAYGADKVYVQDFQGGQTGYATLVMNMLTYNTRFDYLGVVYPIHGHIRDYWYLHFSELGAPVSNEHGYDGFGYCSGPGCDYVVQWFEPSGNNYVAVIYNNTNGTYEQYGQYDSGAPPCTVLDQAKWDNLGCPGGNCGVGGEQDPPPNPADPPPPDNHTIDRVDIAYRNPSDQCHIDNMTFKNSFSTTEQNTDLFVRLSNMQDIQGLYVRWKWYTPSGQVWDEWESWYAEGTSEWSLCDSIDIFSITQYGWWKAEFIIDTVDYHVGDNEYPNDVYTRYFRVYPAMSQPTNLQATEITSSSISLDWDDMPNAAHYEIFRDGVLIDIRSASEYVDVGLNPETEYVYTVVSCWNDIKSWPSEGLTVSTILEITEPPDPSVWTLTDINSPSIPGEAGYYSETATYEVSGSGYDIWGSGAQFTFLHQTLSGDGEIIARVTSQENTGGWAKAGVMVKESTDEYAPYAMMAITPDNGYAFQYNLDGHVGGGGYTFPNAWVKLTRNGDVLTGYVSGDGQNWNQIGTYSVSMQNSVVVGLFVTSNNGSELCTVTFDNVVVTEAEPDLTIPAPWVFVEIDNPVISGEASYNPNDEVFEINGSGYDIWGSGGQYSALLQPLNGNGEIIARVTSQDNTGGWAKAGVIITETATHVSPYAIMALTPSNGYAFQWDYSGHEYGGNYTFPDAWVKLERTDNTFNGYISSDGINWTLVKSVYINMATGIQAGLFVTSNNSNQLCGVTFDNVSVTGSGTGSTGVELLDSAWNLSGNNGSNEKYQSIDSDALNGMESVTITYNLNGLCALGGDASAIIFDQNGWQYISLSDYGINCYDGEQVVTISLDDFDSLDPESSLTGSLHSRIWHSGSFSVDITSIKANPE